MIVKGYCVSQAFQKAENKQQASSIKTKTDRPKTLNRKTPNPKNLPQNNLSHP